MRRCEYRVFCEALSICGVVSHPSNNIGAIDRLPLPAVGLEYGVVGEKEMTK
jgi:hypothetical protein